MNAANVDADVKLLHGAADRHSHAVIDDVAAKLLIHSELQANQIATLSRLWREKLLELTLPTITSTELTTSVQSIQAHIDVLTPLRLTEHIRTLQPIYGCVGRPAPFLKPPQYASQLHKPDRKVKAEDEMVAKKKVKRSAKVNKESETVLKTVECDLVLGMQLKANIRALLTLQPYDTSIDDFHWVVGRVISLSKGSAGKTKVKLRFPNGGEIDTFWPGNAHLQVPETTLISTSTMHTIPATNHNASRSDNINASSSVMDNIFAQLLQSDSSDDDSFTDMSSAHNAGESDALRILLGGFDDFDNSNTASTDAHSKQTVKSSKSDTISSKQIVNDAQLLNITTSSDNTNTQPSKAHNVASSFTSAILPQAHREVALLATGEKVDAFALEEIEQKYAQYRPTFRITPDQGTAGAALQAARRKDRNFTSRQWTSQANTLFTQSTFDDATEQEMEQLMQNVTLAAAEDPSVPLPEPEAVFIGKVAKKLRRGEDVWRTQLYDVAVRDLRRHSYANNNNNNTSSTNHNSSTSHGSSGISSVGVDGSSGNEDASTESDVRTIDSNAGIDLILPRCTITLDATAFTGVEMSSGAYHLTMCSAGEEATSVQDPVAKENLQLLLALCE